MGSNERLIRKCQQKSRKAFEELYKKFSPFVYGICIRYAKNRDEAQDILQDCFIKVMDKIGDYRFEGSFEGWLQRMAVLESLDAISEMPDGYRTIFNMYVVEGYQHNEIAEILNITESTSRSQLKKAREYLIEIIKNNYKRL